MCGGWDTAVPGGAFRGGESLAGGLPGGSHSGAVCVYCAGGIYAAERSVHTRAEAADAPAVKAPGNTGGAVRGVRPREYRRLSGRGAAALRAGQGGQALPQGRRENAVLLLRKRSVIRDRHGGNAGIRQRRGRGDNIRGVLPELARDRRDSPGRAKKSRWKAGTRAATFLRSALCARWTAAPGSCTLSA